MHDKIGYPVQKWTTESIKSGEQFSYWYDGISERIFSIKLDRRKKGPFHGTLLTYFLGPFSINHIRAGEHIAELTYHGISRLSSHYFKFHVQKNSIAKVYQNGCENILNPGDAILIDSLSPLRLDFPFDFECYSIKIPRERLRPLLENPRAATTRPIVGRSPLGEAIKHYIHFLINFARRPSTEGQRELFFDNLLGLIAVATSTSDYGREVAQHAWGEKKIFQIKHYILANLNDPELSPSKVADYFSISISYLHKLFAKEGQTFGNFLRGQRLEYAAMYLQHQEGDGHTITELAYHLGFNDLSYFWRLFRERYGMTPRTFRNLVSS